MDNWLNPEAPLRPQVLSRMKHAGTPLLKHVQGQAGREDQEGRDGGADRLYLLALLNSVLSRYYARSVFQGRFMRISLEHALELQRLQSFPVPAATERQQELMGALFRCAVATEDPRFDQLVNGLVYEQFFPDDLYARNCHLFDACEAAGIVDRLRAVHDDVLCEVAVEVVQAVFAIDHPIYAMLFDLRVNPVAMVVEGWVEEGTQQIRSNDQGFSRAKPRLSGAG